MGITLKPKSTAIAVALIFLFSPVPTSAITTEVLPTSASGCPSKCTCVLTEIKCEGWVPDTVPGNIETVVLTEIDDRRVLYNRSRFCNVTWDSVNNLSIETRGSLYLANNDLDCLSQIKFIALTPSKSSSLPTLSLSEAVFSSLTNVITMKLSGWFDGMEDIKHILKVKTYLPKLTYLDLSKTINAYKIDQDFINALAQRPLQALDISYSEITFDFHNGNGLCTTLTTLLMHDSLVKVDMLPYITVGCESLNLADISRTHNFALKLQTFPCVNGHAVIPSEWFFSAPILRANTLITSTANMHISNCKLIVMADVRKLYFSQNVLQAFEFLLSSTTLLHIDLSRNNIKTIDRNAFSLTPNVENISLSHNKLGEIPSGETNISMLFQNNIFLSSVDLTSNNLSSLPKETFLSNPSLKEIRLANNSFTQTHFTITPLVNLTTLDVRFNQIQLLDSQSMNAINTLYKKQTDGQTVTNNRRETLQVLLEGNPFSCDCESQDFLEWVVESPVFNSDRQTYRCMSRGRQISLIDAGIDAAQEDCELAAQQLRTIILSTTFGVAGIASTVVATFILRKRYKRWKLQKKLTDQLRMIQEENTGLKFPVFLSYCSDDAEFIAQHVREPLQRHLREYTNIDRELVCEGDRHFIPGHNILSEMSRCVGESAAVLAVVSESFCKSYFCKLEIFEAKNTGKPVMLIMKEHVDVKKMDLTIKEIFMNNARAMFVEENGQLTIRPSWEKICEGIITSM